MARLPLVLALAGAFACGSPGKVPAHGAERDWDGFVAEFMEQSFRDDPALAVAQGRHDFDGQVADLSRPGIARSVAHLQAARARAQAFSTEGLDEARRFEREYLLAHVDGELFWKQRYAAFTKNPRLYADAIDPAIYVTRPYASLEVRLDAYLKHLRAVPRVVSSMKANLVKPLSRPFVDVAVTVFRELIPYVGDDVPQAFAAAGDAQKAELAHVTKTALAALRDAVGFLEHERARAHDEFAMGPVLFQEMLWATERVDTPLDQLEAVGRADLARNLAAITSACESFAPGESLAACAQKVNRNKAADGAIGGAREQLTALREFVRAHELVTIPSDDLATVEPAPRYKRWNQAYIEMPGPYERGVPAIYYIAPPDPSWSEADRMAYVPGRADLLFISVHEVWPGHFLQYLHTNRAPRAFGRVFVGYAFAEGWAHYVEEMMWDAGLSKGDSEVRVGQLLNALLRDVRFVSAIGLHTRGMSVAESETLFREQALQDPGNARQQAVRGTFDPAYLNYTLGKLLIQKLRDDFLRQHGMTQQRAFHDLFLSRGGPPIPLLSRALLGREAPLFSPEGDPESDSKNAHRLGK